MEDASSNYIMPSLHLDDGWFIFSSVSKFLSSITPNDMPLSEMRLLFASRAFRAYFTLFFCSLLHPRAPERCISIKSFRSTNNPWGERVKIKMPSGNRNWIVFLLSSSLQALKVESGYICLVAVIFLVSVIPFCYTIAWCFSRNVKLKASNGVSDIVQASARVVLPGEVLFQDECKEKLDKYHCRKRVYVFILQCFIVVSMWDCDFDNRWHDWNSQNSSDFPS